MKINFPETAKNFIDYATRKIAGFLLLFISSLLFLFIIFIASFAWSRQGETITDSLVTFSIVVILFIAISFATYLAGKKGGPRIRALAIFIGYLSSISIFGGTYYSYYLNNPNNFLFSSKIESAKYVEKYDDLLSEVRLLDERLYCALALNEAPNAFLSALADDHVPIRFLNDFTVTYVISVTHGGAFYSFAIEGPNCKVGFSPNNPIEPTSAVVDRLLKAKELEEVKGLLKDLSKILKKERTASVLKIGDLMKHHESWDYLDFVYFSAVTMTTLGYGDIIPNSRIIRLIVMLQTVFGISYFAFALAVFWPSRETTFDKEEP